MDKTIEKMRETVEYLLDRAECDDCVRWAAAAAAAQERADACPQNNRAYLGKLARFCGMCASMCKGCCAER